MAEVQKEQSHRKHRNSNPFPTILCSWGWCIDVSTTPPTFPESSPQVSSTADYNLSSNAPASESAAVQTCGDAMKMALQAAHNVEVGDYYFGEKNYKASLLRYQEALAEKPSDLAIHVRLGRAFEKMSQVPQAIAQYEAAQNLSGPERWSDEAKLALQRLQYSHIP
jgi:tetratricopeptide (TPR) repeat protein